VCWRCARCHCGHLARLARLAHLRGERRSLSGRVVSTSVPEGSRPVRSIQRAAGETHYMLDAFCACSYAICACVVMWPCACSVWPFSPPSPRSDSASKLQCLIALSSIAWYYARHNLLEQLPCHRHEIFTVSCYTVLATRQNGQVLRCGHCPLTPSHSQKERIATHPLTHSLACIDFDSLLIVCVAVPHCLFVPLVRW
jgi:hypothetical protein